MTTQTWNQTGVVFEPACLNITTESPRYGCIDAEGNLTGKYSTKYRDLTPEEAKRLFGTERTVRVGVEE